MKNLPDWITQEQLHSLQVSHLPTDWKLHDFIVDRLSDNPSKRRVICKRLYLSYYGYRRLNAKFLELVKKGNMRKHGETIGIEQNTLISSVEKSIVVE